MRNEETNEDSITYRWSCRSVGTPDRARPDAQAAIDPANFAGVECEGNAPTDACSIALAPGLGILAPQAGLEAHPDGYGFEMTGDLDIPTGGKPVPLADARLSVRLNAARSGVDSLVGTVLMPMPNDGFMEEIDVTERPYAAVGFASGAELQVLEGPVADAPVMPDRNYFFFNAVGRLSAELAPISLQTPGGAGVVVLDPTDPYFYISAELQGLGGDGKEQDASADNGDASNSGADGTDSGVDGSAQNGSDSEGSESGNESGSESENAANENVDEDPNSADENGEDEEAAGIAGFGFSVGGFIPFEPAIAAGDESRIPSFSGHLFQRASIPLTPLPIEATGEFVYDLDPDRDGDSPFTPEAFALSPDLAYGVNGSLDVGIPFLRFFSFGFPLGEASAAIIVSEDDTRAAFSGLVTTEEFLPNLPIPIRPDGRIEVHGLLAANHLAQSYIHAEGEMSIDAGALGALSGVPLGQLFSQEAILDINATGLTLQGKTSVGIHPSVQLEGESGFEVFISPNGDSSLKIFGSFIVGNERLENAEMIVDRFGVRVNGRFLTGENVFEMEGALRSDGYLLVGSAQLADPLEGNALERVELLNRVLSNRQVVAILEDSLASANATLGPLVTAASAAGRAVDTAQASVNSINSSISYQSSRVSSNYNAYRSWSRKRCSRWAFSCKATRAAKTSYYYSRYTYHRGLRSTLYGSRTAATAVLTTARNALSVAESNLSSGQAIVNLAQAELNTGIAALREAEAQLEALPEIEGTLEMIATIGIENGSVFAGVEGQWNGMLLTEGTVSLNDPSEACLLVPTVGTLCSPL